MVCRDGFGLVSQPRGNLNYADAPAQPVHGEGATEATRPYILDAQTLTQLVKPGNDRPVQEAVR